MHENNINDLFVLQVAKSKSRCDILNLRNIKNIKKALVNMGYKSWTYPCYTSQVGGQNNIRVGNGNQILF